MRHQQQQNDVWDENDPARNHRAHQTPRWGYGRDLISSQDTQFALLDGANTSPKKTAAQHAQSYRHGDNKRHGPWVSPQDRGESKKEDQRKEIIKEDHGAQPQRQLDVHCDDGQILLHSSSFSFRAVNSAISNCSHQENVPWLIADG